MGRCSGDTAFRGRPSRTGLVSRGMTSSGPKGRPSASRNSDEATEAGLYSTPNGLTHTSIPASAILRPISAEKQEPSDSTMSFLSIFMTANVHKKAALRKRTAFLLSGLPELLGLRNRPDCHHSGCSSTPAGSCVTLIPESNCSYGSILTSIRLIYSVSFFSK